MSDPLPCIICGQPRDGSRIWCGQPACLEKVLAMPVEEINAIRRQEALDAWKNQPQGRPYIHFTPRED
jgi:hypothetical protein